VLLATYRRSEFIPLEKFALIALEMCPKCSRESDGSPGENGFEVSLATKASQLSAPVLSKPGFFKASPTHEPTAAAAFRKWLPEEVHGKLGGRQVAIQAPLEAQCRLCKGPQQFVGSIDERWAPQLLNFGGGMGYVFVCKRECAAEAVLFYWDCP
jgi:hypothetical protein